MLYYYKLLILILVPLFLSYTLQGQDCSCTEYIYLNEPTSGSVHKYKVETDGSLTEVGAPWVSSPTDFPSPHGLGSDLNGFLYIGQHYEDGYGIRKLTCDGEIIPETEWYLPTGGQTNVISIGNNLYYNDWTLALANANTIKEANVCSQMNTREVTFCESVSQAWGLYLDPNTNLFYSATGQDNTQNYVYIYDDSDFDNDPATCVNPAFEIPIAGNIAGITTDPSGNIYVVMHSPNAFIMKFDASGTLLAQSSPDGADDGTGWAFARGVVYSETSGLLYLSTQAVNDECISVFDTDLNYLGVGVPSAGDGNQGKALAIIKECCPFPSTQNIDRVFCETGNNEPLFLNELFDCDGIVCEGAWVAADPASQAVYNDCDQSIAANIAPGCYSFSKTSDGTGNKQCGTFELNFNLEILAQPEITLSADQTICIGETANLSVTTTGTGFQWQMSTTSCTEGFTDIAGATSAMYMPTITETAYYRVIVTETAGCSDGTCPFESDCITITAEDCPTYDVSLTKSVDLSTASVGDDVVFTITVENLGDAVTGATVNDVLPTGLTYNDIYTASTGTYDGANWTIGDMAVGQTENIQITATVNAEGVINNMASITINETETNPDNNEDKACVSVPIQICNNEAIDVDLIAEAGLTMYQWYKDGVAIDGATNDTYKATEIGTYTYTVDGAGPTGDCTGELCCPIVIEGISCCPPTQCLPVTVTKME